ncbi:myocardin-related transcription factor A [Amblyraja radiata]|uniref:myocardin-related transcription factor A n=1 Tax=Amblyraja radiata TaxID=386614 RepID=UPI0014036C02|nr:myocardin-related transcription factor A [Amblyraja radiata]XP_032869276.1 myocardin-related transcription factor A [Amblyraja radiata]
MEGQETEGRTSPCLRRLCHSTFSQQEERLLQVLQLKLQQRRTREELASQGIMPPLKSPAAFHEQRRSLERARTEDYLKRKIRLRPERAELVRMHILEETSAEPSLQATQMKLKRARLADDLNEKIAQRPGPMELVEKNILPVDSSVKEAIIDNHVPYTALADNSSFDEDSSDALSPEQPGSQDSLGSLPSPTEARPVDQHHPLPTSPTQYLVSLPTGTELNRFKPVSDQQIAKLVNGVPSLITKPAPTLIKQSQPKSARDKNLRNKKLKEPKSRVKKLKYHQYMPPDQKLEKATLPLDTAYSKLLQQQQLFLQLQILCQQQQHYNYQTILPAPPKQNSDHHTSSGLTAMRPLTNSISSSGSGGMLRQNSCMAVIKPPASLPPNLDDLKVAELKQELKLRALPVSGTKTDLIERLRNYQEQMKAAAAQVPTAGPLVSKAGPLAPRPAEVLVTFGPPRCGSAPSIVASVAPADVPAAVPGVPGTVKPGAATPTPPVSPAPSDRSVQSMEENEVPAQLPLPLPLPMPSPMQVVCKEEPANGPPSCGNLRRGGAEPGKDTQAAIKDLMLQEKDKQIEELTRMLRQKQQLVEALRHQLDQEKHTLPPPPQQPSPPPATDPPGPPTVKQEHPPSSCLLSGKPGPHPYQANLPPPVTTVMVKQEGCVGAAPTLLLTASQPSRLTTGTLRTVSQTPAPGLLTNGTGTHLLLTVAPQCVSPPASTVNEQPATQAVTPCPSPEQTQQPAPTSPSKPQPHTGMMTQTGKKEQKVGLQLITGTSGAVLSYAFTPQTLPSFFVNNVTESSLQTRVNNGSTSPHKEISRSQEMDDLFDILIESGEISVNAKDITATLDLPSPPSVSPTLTMSPPLSVLKVEPPSPQLLLEPITDSQSESRLEDFLVSTTGVPLLSVDHDGTQPLSLIDDLHNQMLSSSSILEHSHSPMDTSDLHFTTDTTSLTLDLADTNLDNMEWLDLTMGGSSVGLAPLSSVTPSVFSTDFLDGHDLHLHWD